jgi:chromosomal replication initiation ATPase DnaA
MITREQRDEALQLVVKYHQQNINYFGTIAEITEQHKYNSETLTKVFDLITEHDLLNRTRVRHVVEKRQALMYWIYNNLKMSMDDVIDLFFTDEKGLVKNHTNVHYACKTIKGFIETNQLTENMNFIFNELKPYERP